MTLPKRIEAITAKDLSNLASGKVGEGREIEFKSGLPGRTHDAHREFLADVSSFANAVGGHLVLGIRAIDGIASELVGFESSLADSAKTRLENLLRDGIAPRIHGVAIKSIEISEANSALIVQVPRSWSGPHAVSFEKHFRFYSRNSAGKYPLDVGELRTAFGLADATTQRIREFRADRLGRIVAGETPVDLPDGARLILHLVPIDAFGPGANRDLSGIAGEPPLPLYAKGCSGRYNFDGFVTYLVPSRATTASTYLQVFRNGCVEAVETYLLRNRPDGQKIPSTAFEKELLGAVPRLLRELTKMGVAPPVFLMLSLIGVRGYEIGVSQELWSYEETHNIDRDELIVPEMVIDDFSAPASTFLRHVFDVIWNAGGWAGSRNFDDDGNWVGR